MLRFIDSVGFVEEFSFFFLPCFPLNMGFFSPGKYVSLVDYYWQVFVPWPVVTYSFLLWLRILKGMSKGLEKC